MCKNLKNFSFTSNTNLAQQGEYQTKTTEIRLLLLGIYQSYVTICMKTPNISLNLSETLSPIDTFQ